MRTFFIHLVLLLFGCSVSLRASSHAEFASGIRKDLEQSTFETIRRAMEISAQEQGEQKLSKWIADQKESPILVGGTLVRIGDSIKLSLIKRLRESQLENMVEKFKRAYDDTASYLGLDQRVLIQRAKLVTSVSHRDRILSNTLRNRLSETLEVNWRGVDHYVHSRLGPLRGILKNFRSSDRVLLTNLDKVGFSPFLNKVSQLLHMKLPLASYGKEVYLAQSDSGQRTLILSNFDSKSYLIHFGLMIQRFSAIRGKVFEIDTLLSSARFEKSNEQLLNFAKKNPKCFQNLDALIIGYSRSFLNRWKGYPKTVAMEADGGSETWRATRFLLPGGKSAVVLGGDVDFHGERLMSQIEKLVAEYPVKYLFFGGSGGSLLPKKPYSLSLPGVILDSEEGCQTKNILDGSRRSSVHVSVDSPMEETPLKMLDFRAGGVATIDMELGRLSCLSLKYGIQLGAAILVTDYPISYGSFHQELGKQNFGAKDQARKEFSRIVEERLLRGKKSYVHPLEESQQKSMHQMSIANLQTLRKSHPLPEQSFLDSNVSTASRINLRMSLGRLYYGLKNGALYSTGLVRVLGYPVKPFTPELEHRVFGAWDYIFAEYSTGTGWERYGEVVAFLKPEKVLKRSFATEASAYRLTKGDTKLELRYRQQELSQRVFVPEHYGELLAYQRARLDFEIDKLERKLKGNQFEELEKELKELKKQRGLKYLELKIPDYVLMSEIHSVWVPAKTDAEMLKMLEEHGIFYKIYESNQ